jgi:hypothetical protein
LSGVALLIGGLLFSIGNLLHPTEHSAAAHESATWSAAHITFMVGMLGILLGLPALYARQAHRIGLLGLVGYTAFFIGIAWTLSGSWFEAFGIPHLDEASIHAVEHGSGVPYNVVGGMLFILGQVAFGYALFRTRAYPRVPSLAMVVAGVALLPASGMTGPTGGVILIACTAVLGFALAYLGRHLMIAATAVEMTDDVRASAAPSQSMA